MQRCLALALKGAGQVAPNPMVGAVLVFEDRIIGEGWHQRYGEAHAEVKCLQSVKEEDRGLIVQSILYVSLEPCAHFGKTPPCADLIIQHKIPKVVIGCRDPFDKVNGKGIEKLNAAGVEVVFGMLEQECIELNKRFFTFHKKKRPYIILKWAQTKDGKMASWHPIEVRSPGQNFPEEIAETVHPRLLISNEYSNRLVHRWRSEEAAILVGTRTALLDDPELTTRLWPGKSPVRLVLDMDLQLPSRLRLFDKKVKTIVFNSIKQAEEGNLVYYKIEKGAHLVTSLMNALYSLHIQSVLVEGGAKMLQSFIDNGIWDEARIITNEMLLHKDGLDAPEIYGAEKKLEEKLLSDKIEYFIRSAG